MSDVAIAAIAAIGISAWLFKKIIRRTGGNMRTTLISTTSVGVIIFFVIWSLLHLYT